MRDVLKIVKFVGQKGILPILPVTDKHPRIFQSLVSRASALMAAGLKYSPNHETRHSNYPETLGHHP